MTETQPAGCGSSWSTTTRCSAPACAPSSARARRRGRRGRRRSTRRSRSIPRPQPDVVLLDVHMPDGGGAGCCEACRRTQPDVASSRCRSPTPPRTSSPSSGPARAATSPRRSPDRAGRRDPPGRRRRRRVLARGWPGSCWTRSPRAGRARSPIPSSTSSPTASARCCACSPAATPTRRSPRAVHLGQDGRDARVERAAQAPAVQPLRAVALGRRPPPGLIFFLVYPDKPV